MLCALLSSTAKVVHPRYLTHLQGLHKYAWSGRPAWYLTKCYAVLLHSWIFVKISEKWCWVGAGKEAVRADEQVAAVVPATHASLAALQVERACCLACCPPGVHPHCSCLVHGEHSCSDLEYLKASSSLEEAQSSSPPTAATVC